MRKLWPVGIGVLALLALGLYALARDRQLTEIPERRAGEAAAFDSTSFVSVSIRLRHDALAELLDEQVPRSFEIPAMSMPGGRSSRTAVQGSGQVERTSPVNVAGADAGISATTRLQAAYSLGNDFLGTETVQAEADVMLGLAVDIDTDWKPVIALQPTFTWIQPPESRLTRMFNISLAGLAEGQATAILGRVERQLPQLIEDRFNLASLFARTWEASHARLQVSESPLAWLTLRPLGAHFLTPRSDADALLLETGFSASFSVSGDAAGESPVPTPLPPLGKEPPPVEGIRLAVPVTMGYEALSGILAAALRQQSFSFPVGDDMAEVRVTDVVVYPSAPKLVLGLHVESHLPRQWLDTKGWVHVSATPVFDPATGVLELRDPAFARSVDNRWIRLFSAALQARLVRELERNSRFDLAATIERAKQAVNERMHAQLQQQLASRMADGPGRVAERIVVSGGLGGIESATFSLADAAITFYPVVTGSLSVELVPLNAKAAD